MTRSPAVQAFTPIWNKPLRKPVRDRKKEAIGNAHYQRNLKKAVEDIKANPTENIQQFKDAIAQTNSSAKNDTVDIAKLKEELESNSNQSRQLSWADIKFSTPDVGDKNSKD